MTNKDNIPNVDSLLYRSPNGKIVYGGGGIIPDVFIAIDTSSYLNNFYFKAINDFAINYVDSNRKKITQKWNLDLYINDFDTDEKVFRKFYSKIKEFKPSVQTKTIIKKYLKLSIANEIFGDEGFYKFQHIDDKMIQKVLELETNQE